MQIDLIGAEIVWPEDARDYERFNLVTEVNSTSLVLFRKLERETPTLKISSFYIPRLMSEYELDKLVKIEGDKQCFEEGCSSYWQSYTGRAVAVFYFKNMWKNKKIVIENELEMVNMQIRGEPPGVTTFEFVLLPGEGRLVIVDAKERERDFSFEQSLGYRAEDMEEEDFGKARRQTVKRLKEQKSIELLSRQHSQTTLPGRKSMQVLD